MNLIQQLPINAVVFSPAVGGTECYVIIKKESSIMVRKAHEEDKYQGYKGKFKKPDIGMFVVMRDVAWEEFKQHLTETNSLMIGDTWHDQAAAKSFGIPFLSAELIHQSKNNSQKLSNLLEV